MKTATAFRGLSLLFIGITFLIASGTAEASHSWGGYHWARTASPFTLTLGDNVSGVWDTHLRSVSVDWNSDPAVAFSGSGLAKIINTAVVAGTLNPRTCKAVAGTVQVCNSNYGNTGWLGIAQIWASGTHITQGTAKMNDTYFNTAKYNNPAWRNLVMCQEVAHTFGLDHQDEVFGNVNLGSCMDYTNAPAGGLLGGFNYGPTNEHPNFHDFEELGIIYAHLDTTSTARTIAPSSAARTADFTNASEWGKSIRTSSDGRKSLYVRDLGNGEQVFTFVVWAE